MTRQIKIRAWHHGLSRMFSADEMSADQLAMLPNGFFINAHSNINLSKIFDHDEMQPLQFTGLKDASGIEIYEGDILEERKGSYFSVVWDTKWAKFKLQHPPMTIQYPEWNRGMAMTIVGNIYENPDIIAREIHP